MKKRIDFFLVAVLTMTMFSRLDAAELQFGNAEIQLGGLGNGVYIAKVTADNAAKTVKFVK